MQLGRQRQRSLVEARRTTSAVRRATTAWRSTVAARRETNAVRRARIRAAQACFSVSFYILLRAVDRFVTNYNRFPGVFDNEIDDDISRLKTIAVGVLGDSGLHGSTLSDDLVNEMCRFGGGEIHAVAAFIGGVASQEAIKVCDHIPYDFKTSGICTG
ncbi:NEDD8-activating enzyme E1 regulatory subunit [Platanthera guangdongensis]|uniref:NEDD8-activating enzyme E1 regulatory subunit n=1 Tax=Platanthera guangdongensis TaxID=2320717 RepID=A0ABR2MU51_9ASPA